LRIKIPSLKSMVPVLLPSPRWKIAGGGPMSPACSIVATKVVPSEPSWTSAIVAGSAGSKFPAPSASIAKSIATTSTTSTTSSETAKRRGTKFEAEMLPRVH